MDRRKLLTSLGAAVGVFTASKITEAKPPINIGEHRFFAEFGSGCRSNAMDQYFIYDGEWANVNGFYVPRKCILLNAYVKRDFKERWEAEIRKNDNTERGDICLNVHTSKYEWNNLNITFDSGDEIQPFIIGKASFPKLILEFAYLSE